jgi:hypothetical protein
MSCPLILTWVDGVKPSFMLEVEIPATEPLSLVYFVEAVVIIFLFFLIIDNPTRKFLTNRIAAFFKFGPIKLIYSEKTPSRVKKQPAE